MKSHLLFTSLVVITLVFAAGCSGGEAAAPSSSSSASSGTSSMSSASSSSSSKSQSSSSSSVVSSSSSSASSTSSFGSSSSSRSSSTSSSASSSASSIVSGGSCGTVNTTPGALNCENFRATPTLPNGLSRSEWVNGETRLVKDNGSNGSGDLFGFVWSDSNNDTSMYLIVSTDNGATWTNKAHNTGSAGDPYQVLALTQDSTGTVHAITSNTYTDSGYYRRITLTYTSGHISGFTVDQTIALPNHGSTGIQKRADIKAVTDNSNAETIVYSLGLTTSASQPDLKVYMAKSSSLTPSSFTAMNGTGSDTKVFDSCNYNCSGILTFQTHNHTALFAQNGATHDLYLFQGPIDGDYGYNDGSITSANTIYVTQLTSGSSGWTAGTTSTISSNSSNGLTPELMSVASGASYAWIMYVDPLNGIKFGRINSNGQYDESAVSSPYTTNGRNGWGVFSVSLDDSKIWAIWDTLGALGANPNASEGYWNGSSWVTFNDAGASDSMGMAGVSGWRSGTAVILFNGAVGPQTYSQPTAASIWSN